MENLEPVEVKPEDGPIGFDQHFRRETDKDWYFQMDCTRRAFFIGYSHIPTPASGLRAALPASSRGLGCSDSGIFGISVDSIDS